MGENQAVHHWRKGDARRQCVRYPAVYQWGILDSSHWSALAGFAGNVWKLEECTPGVLPVARQGDLGKDTGSLGG